MDKGYQVGINAPYSNSMAPNCGFVYHSIMLEVNKKTYLQSNSTLLRDNGLRDDIREFMTCLLD